MSLDDAVRANSPGSSFGPGGALNIPLPRHTPAQPLFNGRYAQPSFSVDEFKSKQGQPGFNGAYHPAHLTSPAPQQSAPENAVMGSQASTTMNMHPFALQAPVHHNMHPAFGARAYPSPFGAQSGIGLENNPYAMAANGKLVTSINPSRPSLFLIGSH